MLSGLILAVLRCGKFHYRVYRVGSLGPVDNEGV